MNVSTHNCADALFKKTQAKRAAYRVGHSDRTDLLILPIARIHTVTKMYNSLRP